MSKYRSRQSSGISVAAPQPLAPRAPRAPATPVKSSKFRMPPTSKVVSRFKLDNDFADDYLDNVNVSPRQGTVQEEFDKYTAASPSPLHTDILHFWEVSHNHINKDKCADWNNTDQQGRVSDIVQHCPGLPPDPGIFSPV
jgi:hypothetical protein